MFIKWDMFDEIRCGMSAKTLPSLDNNVRKIQTKGRLKFAGEASTGAHGVQPRRPGRRARRSAAASRKGRRPRIPGPRWGEARSPTGRPTGASKLFAKRL